MYLQKLFFRICLVAVHPGVGWGVLVEAAADRLKGQRRPSRLPHRTDGKPQLTPGPRSGGRGGQATPPERA